MSEVTLSVTSRVKGYGCYKCGRDLKAGDTVHSFRWDGDLIAHHEDCCSPYCPDKPPSLASERPLTDAHQNLVSESDRP